MRAYVEDVPTLTPPAEVVHALVGRLGAVGQPRERVYLSSRLSAHRWAQDSFPDLQAEFVHKAVWVAKLLRDQLGAPEHWAYLVLAESSLVGVRAAGWFLGSAVAYVSLRRRPSTRGRTWFNVVLGAVRPTPRSSYGPEGIDARAALLVADVAPLVH